MFHDLRLLRQSSLKFSHTQSLVQDFTFADTCSPATARRQDADTPEFAAVIPELILKIT